MFRRLLIAFLLLAFYSRSQVPAVSRYELSWALIHPFAALKVKQITKKCYPYYRLPSTRAALDSFSNGGRLDAFRHVFFMAAYAQKIKTRKLRRLGIAHEKANYQAFLHSKQEEGEVPDSLGTVMDLRNNELGLEIGPRNKKVPLDSLVKIVLAEIGNHKAVIIKRNPQGQYTDCAGDPIHLQDYRQRWSIPKCLVSSGK